MRISLLNRCLTSLALLGLAGVAGCARQAPVSPELAAAIGLIREGDYSGARETLTELASLHPDDPAVYANLGIAHWRLGETGQAVPALNRAAALDPDDQRPLQIIARLFIEQRNTDGALDVLDDIPAPDARTRVFKAMAHYRAGRTDRALVELNRAQELAPHYPPALYNLAILHRDARLDPEAALRHYEAFRKAARTHPLARHDSQTFLAANPRLADMQQPDTTPPTTPADSPEPETLAAAREAVAAADYEAAVILYEQAVNERPDRPDALWEMADVFEHHLGFEVRAIELRRRFRRMFPTDPRGADMELPDEPPAQRAQTFFDEGMQHLNADRAGAAAAAFRRSLDLDPESPGAAYNLGLAEHRRGNPAAAVAALEQAAARDPDMPDAVYMIALIERERGNTARAVARLNHLLRRHPDYASAHMLLGLIYRDNERPREAAAHFEQVIALEPDGPSARFARAWLDRHGPDRERAP